MSIQQKKLADHSHMNHSSKSLAEKNRIPKKEIEKGLDELFKTHGKTIKELARR